MRRRRRPEELDRVSDDVAQILTAELQFQPAAFQHGQIEKVRDHALEPRDLALDQRRVALPEFRGHRPVAAIADAESQFHGVDGIAQIVSDGGQEGLLALPLRFQTFGERIELCRDLPDLQRSSAGRMAWPHDPAHGGSLCGWEVPPARL